MTNWEMFDESEMSPAQRWDEDITKRALDELFAFAGRYNNTESFKELLDFLIRFKRYAPFNDMLVHIQKPGARYVLTASRWRQDYDRRVKAKAQPLMILQPMGPVMFVFDVSDTEGKALPEEITNPFAVSGPNADSILFRTTENALRDGVRVQSTRFGSQQAGLLRKVVPNSGSVVFRDHPVPLRFELVLSDTLTSQSKFATLVHELGHLYCGHLGTPNPEWWPDRRGLDKHVLEFEAESVAYLVCRRAGLDPHSDRYLSGYLKDKGEIPPISLTSVMKAAGTIEEMTQRGLPRRRTRRRR